MIAVSFALRSESSAFLRAIHARRIDAIQSAGEHLKKKVIVVHTGVGAAICEKRMRQFLGKEKPRMLISSGFCGGTSDHLRPGEMVIATNRSAPELVQLAREQLPNARLGTLFSADQVIDPETDRYRIGREHGAIAIDMETATIAQVAAEIGVPMLSLRVVSDSPKAPFPAPPPVLFDVARQRTRARVLLPHLARYPATIPRLARFSQQVTYARKELAGALGVVLDAV